MTIWITTGRLCTYSSSGGYAVPNRAGREGFVGGLRRMEVIWGVFFLGMGLGLVLCVYSGVFAFL